MSRPILDGFEAIPRPVQADACLFCCVRNPRCLARHVATIDTGADWGRDDSATIMTAQRTGQARALADAIMNATASGWVVLDMRDEVRAFCPDHAETGLAADPSGLLRRTT